MGEILYETGQYKLALNELQYAIQIDPNGWYIYQTHIKVGLCHFRLKMNSQATIALEKGILIYSKVSNKKADIWVRLARETKKKINNNTVE